MSREKLLAQIEFSCSSKSTGGYIMKSREEKIKELVKHFGGKEEDYAEHTDYMIDHVYEIMRWGSN
jgi:hypothetical protein